MVKNNLDTYRQENEQLLSLLAGAIEAIEILRLLGKLTGHETEITDKWLSDAKSMFDR